MKTDSEITLIKSKINTIVKNAKLQIMDEIKNAKYIGQADDWVDPDTGDISPNLSKKTLNAIIRDISDIIDDEKFEDVMHMDLISHGIVTTYDLIAKKANDTKRYLESIRKANEETTKFEQKREALKQDPEYKTFLRLQKKFKIM